MIDSIDHDRRRLKNQIKIDSLSIYFNVTISLLIAHSYFKASREIKVFSNLIRQLT